MRLVELQQAPLEGALNVSPFYALSNETVLGRIPKANPAILESLAYEYHSIGFTGHGGSFRRRSPKEQFAFVNRAASHGLRVLEPGYINANDHIFFPFLSAAQTWDNALPALSDQDAGRLTYELFDDLRRAHSAGIVYGDRWSQNILVDPTFGILHIDFDLEISGKCAKDFEVAQAVYYTLCAGRERIIPLLKDILLYGDWFNIYRVDEFVRKHSVFFNRSQKYGSTEVLASILMDKVLAQKVYKS